MSFGFPPAVTDLPHLNVLLNGTAALALGAGYVFIRQRRVRAHWACMLSAVAASGIFLASYLVYHFHVGSVRFQGEGWLRYLYFTILISHSILAVAVLPMALTTLYRAWKRQFDRHRWVAQWTFPVWMYVSVTGIAVYLLLYHLG